jgi:hypothetical protein
MRRVRCWRSGDTSPSPLGHVRRRGYGLFGVISSVRLRLTPRRLLERVVDIMDIDRLIPALDAKVASGFVTLLASGLVGAHRRKRLRVIFDANEA